MGSDAYVTEQVDNGTIGQIEANLNFDMIGSPNFARFVYDGDLSDSDPPPSGAPAGSAPDRGALQPLLRSPWPGLPAHRLRRPVRLRAVHRERGPGRRTVHRCRGHQVGGGRGCVRRVAGLAYDPCYHQACDTFFNLSYPALDQMSDAAAHATWTLARRGARSPTPRQQLPRQRRASARSAASPGSTRARSACAAHLNHRRAVRGGVNRRPLCVS